MAWSFPVRRRRVASLVAAAVLITSQSAFAQPAPTPPTPAPTPAPAADAKTALADADKAVKAKDWTAAAKAFDAANKAQPSADALEGLATAYYNNGQIGDAYNAYTDWLVKYGAKAPAAKKTTAEARVKEIGDRTGAISLNVNEAGAAVIVDEKPAGTTPLPASLRLTPGPHHIRVTKDGFTQVDQNPNVAVGATNTVNITLVAASAKGKLAVKEKTGKPVRVTVDNVDMGDAPWTGDVDPGPHDVGARGQGLAAAPQKVTIERGKTAEIELVASSSIAPMKVNTTDNKGLIYLDEKLVGEGSYVADVPSGVHKLKITREGYDPFEEEVTLKDKELYSRTIVLKLVSKIETGVVQDIERLEGFYGGFSLQWILTPGGTGSSMEKTCDDTANRPGDLINCKAPDGMGGGIGGFVGYHWDPVGIELYFAGEYDQRSPQNEWKAPSTNAGIGPDPARTEDFTVRRAGGMAMARIRLTHQWPKIRLSFAAGAGLAYRAMFLDRETTAKDGPGRNFVTSDGLSYTSPVVGFEPSVSYRVSKGVAATVGFQLFLEAPSSGVLGGNNPKTTAQPNQTLGLSPLNTPSYELASNVQVFVGPFLGMMFGP